VVLNRFVVYLTRLLAVVVVAAVTTAGVTWAASHGVPATGATPPAVKPRAAAPLMVPDVRNLAFVFAKETLEDAGFAWRVAGKVHGFPANTVVVETPSPGVKLVDHGAPVVVLRLKRAKGYPQVGEPQDVSPYAASKAVPAGLAKG
jgi:beta-lactam-binding protein with PASTA domain